MAFNLLNIVNLLHFRSQLESVSLCDFRLQNLRAGGTGLPQPLPTLSVSRPSYPESLQLHQAPLTDGWGFRSADVSTHSTPYGFNVPLGPSPLSPLP